MDNYSYSDDSWPSIHKGLEEEQTAGDAVKVHRNSGRTKRKARVEQKQRTQKKKTPGIQFPQINISMPLIIAGVLLCTVIIAAGVFLLRRVNKSITVEAGTQMVAAENFLRRKGDTGSLITDLNLIDFNKPGTHEIELKIDGKNKTYKSTLNIKDTIPPQASAVNPQVGPGTVLEAGDFVDEIEDVTDVTISFKKEPDFSKEGRQSVTVVLKDEGGNKTEIKQTLTIGTVRTYLFVEAGTRKELTVEDFLLDELPDARLMTDTSGIDFDVPGLFEARVSQGDTIYACEVEIGDTMAPQVSAPQAAVIWQGQELNAEDLIESYWDVSEVNIYFLDNEIPDTSAEDFHTVSIVVEDIYQNRTLVHVPITAETDTEPPQIIGAQDRTVYQDEKVAYKKDVYVEDNSGLEIELEVDAGQVEISQLGTYPVTYTAADASGNEASVTVQFTVIEKPENAVTEEEVFEEADRVLAEIADDSMSQWDIGLAIYQWCHDNITYTSDSDKTNWLIGAHQAFTLFEGDCFNFFAAAKALLERAGIENIDVVKTGGGHYWSMLNMGEGWYHFDATPWWGDGSEVLYMVTDEWLKEYSLTQNDSHVWDADLYPATPEAEAVGERLIVTPETDAEDSTGELEEEEAWE